MKKIIFFTLVFCFFISGCQKAEQLIAVTGFVDDSEIAKGNPAFYRREKSGPWIREELKTLPEITGMGFDLRSHNVSEFDLSKETEKLKNITFDTNTIWPNLLSDRFNPEKIMEIGKNPGLGIRNIHRNGITGKGINMAIVDQSLLLEHEEYKDNIMTYELINCYDDEAAMHGTAVTSIAIGKNCGIAPDSKVYYIASTFANISNDGISFSLDLTPMAEGIKRIIEINNVLPDDEKIKVISISRGFDDGTKGSKEVIDAIEEAKSKGIFIITTSNENTYGFSLAGLGRDFLKSPDDFLSYKPGMFWENSYYNGEFNRERLLLVPMDSRAIASFTGEKDYMFQASGGFSWAVPWLAGMYCLALQEHPNLTPEIFIDKAFETGEIIEINHLDKTYKLGTIINPENLLESLDNM